MTGALATYQPRRHNERVIERDNEAKYVDIETIEDNLFWFRQRILQYGKNAQVLQPQWLAQQIKEELKQAYQNYESAAELVETP